MSGRGKGGKGLGKRRRTEEYEWEEGENVYVISYHVHEGGENKVMTVPVSRVDAVLKHVVDRMSSPAVSWDMCDVDTMDDFFENITNKEYGKLRGNNEEEESEEKDEEEEEQEEEDEIEDKEEVIDELRDWIEAISESFEKIPPKSVTVKATVVFTDQ